MAGHDPYSASKGMTELLVSSWRRSYLSAPGSAALASGRAGNVIGGGDFSADRIIPDCIRALEAGTPAIIRNRRATRPWQHVLEPLAGYLWLGACLVQPSLAPQPSRLREGFNFGPRASPPAPSATWSMRSCANGRADRKTGPTPRPRMRPASCIWM
jgi:CDP-glucose 4,6-dehydratase